MTLCSCGHSDDTPTQVCLHLRDLQREDYARWFRGIGRSYVLLCDQCAPHPEQAPLVTVCGVCFRAIEQELSWQGVLGEMLFAERATSLRFAHTLVAPFTGLAEPIVDIQPIEQSDRSLWLAVTGNGVLHELDLPAHTARQLETLPQGIVDLAQPVTLHLAPDARFVAVVNRFGRFGQVIDLTTGTPTLQLDRGTYHEDVCVFPVAFVPHQGRMLLIHATDWNRLDISDPATGALLTARGPTSYTRGEVRPEHYLDYFHCGLSVSPDQRWIVDNGWVWHPWGSLRTWSVERWLEENVWESEDGSSLQELCDRAYFWDGPLCWIDATTLEVWGEGRDDEEMLPAVRLFDVATSTSLDWFPGPDVAPHHVWPPRSGRSGWIVYNRYLFAISPEHGTSVWDIVTGERLLHDAAFVPLRYRRGAAQFLTLHEDGSITISHLVDETGSAVLE